MSSKLIKLAAVSLLFSTSMAVAQNIDFGDDSGAYTNDGECDDPRFFGTGMASALSEDDIRADASDCRALYEVGGISIIRTREEADIAECATIDFGDNSSQWANDNECDDPRFTGDGVDEILLPEDLRADANDCRSLCEAGSIWLKTAGMATPVSTEGVDFGDDSSSYANDGECDDPRFIGAGTAAALSDEDIRTDASDCRALFEVGFIRLIRTREEADIAECATIDFGDNSSQWANDNECDDPRFTGDGVDEILLPEDLRADANDCRSLCEAGSIWLK